MTIIFKSYNAFMLCFIYLYVSFIILYNFFFKIVCFDVFNINNRNIMDIYWKCKEIYEKY